MDQKKRSFPLRLPVSLRRQATDLAEGDGISLNQFIGIAVAEKIGHMEEQARIEKSLLLGDRPLFPRIGSNSGGK